MEQGGDDQWNPVTELDAWVDELVDFHDEMLGVILWGSCLGLCTSRDIQQASNNDEKADSVWLG